MNDTKEVDLRELFAELKKHGPLVFIEINDEEEDVTVRVWVE